MNRNILFIAALIALLAACAPAATPAPAPAPTVDTAMQKESPTADAMMPKETASPDAMMGKEAGTPDAMMPKETPDAMTKGTPGAMMAPPPDQITSPHFVDSAPKHGDTFAQPPERIVINFDFTLHEDSDITVTRDGTPVTTEKATLGANKLSLSTTLPADAGDGLYVVDYTACWPDRSCHDGKFAFTVDSKTKSGYSDQTGQREVTIRLKGVQFDPARVVISKGTKVTWVNDDPVTHFVNTDPHPSHNALPALNSFEIKPGERYGFTFDRPGEWAYHCSAHVPQNMLARIIVADDRAMTKPADAMTQPNPAAAPSDEMKNQAPAENLPAHLVAPHFVFSTPGHGELLAHAPASVRIEFDFDVHSASNIAVSKDGQALGGIQKNVGQFSIETALPADAGDGVYVVKYNACWPDQSCHPGQFAFVVDSKAR